MPKRIDLFVIDGENDFCASGTEPDNWPWPYGGRRQGSLFVKGADKEAQAVGDFIKKNKGIISKIHATLDAHHKNDCAHHTAWKGRDGKSPGPFTLVSHDDVKKQILIPRFAFGVWHGTPIPSVDWALKYTDALAKNGRNVLTLWPEHCVIQTWGACTYWPLQEAYDAWCERNGGWIDWITKGQWPFTEHYSALLADVPDDTRKETQLNADVINDAFAADLIIWTGWAGSHCLKWTALDAVNMFGAGKNPFLEKSIFASDASAPVPNPPFPNAPNFEQWRIDFLNEVKNRGARVMTLAEISAEIAA